MTFFEIAVILIAHYIADFLFQTEWMAKNKSKLNIPLFVHCFTYTIIFYLCLFPIAFEHNLFGGIFIFAIISGILHFCVDYITSRLSAYKYKIGHFGSNSVPNLGFFSVIGLDQLVHYLMLFWVYIFMFK